MISCNEYDQIEIVCMHRYPIKITMKSGAVIECTAIDTDRNKDREECMKVIASGNEVLVELKNISLLEVCMENPHFSEISFDQLTGSEENSQYE